MNNLKKMKSIFLYLIFLLSCATIVVNSTTTCKSCIKAFDLNNTLIGNTIVTGSYNVTVVGNAAYNNLVEHGPHMNVTGTITTPYNIQPIVDIINMAFPCDCNATYSSNFVDNKTIYPGKTCFTSTSNFFLAGTITFDALGDPSSVFILTFQSNTVNLIHQTVLLNNAQPCNINFIAPGQIHFNVLQPFYGNFFTNQLTFDSSITIYGGLYASNNINFPGITNIYGCSCQLPENQYNQCTPHTNHKQIIYNVKCSNSLPCS
jgi:hypothetical protein